ncbi:MAG: nucleotidyltransferase [Myxococcota bacterium]
MKTVPQAMQQFIFGLEIPSCENGTCGRCDSCSVRRQRDALRGHLETGLSVSEFRISGSFDRSTAVRPLHDIDLFVVLNRDDQSTPASLLARIRQLLGDAYPNKEQPKEQSRSISVEFTGTGLSFDVVPAYPHPDGGYSIPDRDVERWIRSDPRIHHEHSVERNKLAGDMAKPIVKALKRWNQSQAKKVVGSFHLELMVYDVLRSKPTSFAEGIAESLQGLASRVTAPMPEPAGIGPDVDARLTRDARKVASTAFQAAARDAGRAVDADQRGRPSEAHQVWRALLGSDYQST